MNPAGWSIRNRTVVSAAMLALFVVGLWSYATISRLEDPEFTIREAQVITQYPGASPSEVADEVTDEIESAVQRIGQVERVTSVSEAGRSTVSVRIHDRYPKDDLPQIWDEVRHRVSDAQRHLPPGVPPSVVIDDYGDVYGVFYAVYGDGYTYAELKEHAKMLRRELLLVSDVGKIDLFGEQPEAVYVEFLRERIAPLGLSPDVLYRALEGQNLATDAGHIRAGSLRLRLDPTGTFRSVKDIEDLLVIGGGPEQPRLYLRDLATITRGSVDPPAPTMRFNGQPAIGIAISTVEGGNVVRMGEAVEARMRELEALTPIGIEIGLIAHQAIAVTEAVNGFILSLVQALAIVVVVLMIVMGLRSGLLIAVTLLLTVLGTFFLMKSTGVMLERVSLGALIIALGMLVDNAVVVLDGMQVRLRQGKERLEAAVDVVKQTGGPLLGATLITILAFAAIGLSNDSTGEYTRSLFNVILYSLLLSWILGVTFTPLLGYWFLKAPPEPDPSMYDGRIYRGYRWLLNGSLRYRRATMLLMLLLLGAGVAAFTVVDRSFFPPSTRAQFMVHYWLPQGSHITETERDAVGISEHLRAIEGVTDVAAFIGSSSPRFLLTFTPEPPDTAYALLVVGVEDARRIPSLKRELERALPEHFPHGRSMSKRFALGPSQLSSMEIRLRGPDQDVLHHLAGRVTEVLRADRDIINIIDDWRERVKVVRPEVSEMRARDAGLTRRQIADAMHFYTDGMRVGVYREGDKLLPIIARPPQSERERIDDVRDGQIWSPAAQQRIPMQQVVNEFRTAFEFSRIQRRDRLPTITIGADSHAGNASAAVARLGPELDAIALPPGVTLEWGGDEERSHDAQAAVLSNVPLVGLLMLLIVLALFNAVRQPLIIILILPLAIVGVSFGLLLTGQPFGFMAMLGFLSLSGMLIKNAIVLLDELDRNRAAMPDQHRAVLDAGVSRLAPVVLAALTTVLGMIPLLTDPFFISMAVTIMAGLTFATVLTMIVVPVLYAMAFRVEAK